MKIIFSAVALLIVSFANAQTKLVPAKNVVDKKWLKNQKYQMIWYAMKGTSKIEIGKVKTQVSNNSNQLTVITQVSMKRMNAPWIDTTIAEINTLKPIRHSSYNGQRDMELHFGKIVTGFYNDKIKKVTTVINDTTREAYFDSNLYPTLITWLPLKEGYKQEILIYDYNPNGKIGVLKAKVENVKKGNYISKKSGTRDVWVVSVSDEIGGGENSMSVYYIGITDRKLWKQEINATGRQMIMERTEN